MNSKIRKRLKRIFNPILKNQLDIYYKITDENDRVIKKDICESLNGNFLSLLFANYQYTGSTSDFVYSSPNCLGVSNGSVNRVSDGSPVSSENRYYWLTSDLSAGLSGLVVGTSDTAVTACDWKLGAAIQNGTSSGQLTYGTQKGTSPAVTDTTLSTMTLSRTFTNNSGSDITIKEIGLYVTRAGTGLPDYTILVLRDVIDSTVISNGSSLTLTLTYKVRT